MEPRRGAANSCALAVEEGRRGHGGGRVGAAPMSVVVGKDKASHNIQITASRQRKLVPFASNLSIKFILLLT